LSITIELPADIEARVRAIPDLDQRVAEFLRNQAGLEEWRGRRYSPDAKAVVAGAMAEAARLREDRVSREQAFRDLREAGEQISKHL